MSEPTPGAYEAAIDYLGRHIDIDPDSDRWLLDDRDVRGLAAAIGAVGVAAGRAQAAADIRARAAVIATRSEARAGVPTGAVDDHPFMLGTEWAARIAEGGEPRG